uniref:Uncharacterized protein n=1 Tax=Rhizophora mucronata TaxID=61149 RepID=A0A2P2KNG1_RHIMU
MMHVSVFLVWAADFHNVNCYYLRLLFWICAASFASPYPI